MATKLFLLIPLLAGSSLFLSGTWTLPFHRPVTNDPYPFVANPDNKPIDDPRECSTLLESSLQRFAPHKLRWLQATVWQRMSDREVAFEAHGTLNLAPHGCARLDMTVQRNERRSRWLFVCDGHAFAEERQIGDATPSLQSDHAPKGEEEVQRAFLQRKGCGGPWPLLKELQERMQQVKARRGSANGLELIELRGVLAQGNAPGHLALASPATEAIIYLEAATLWPHRLEWRAAAAGRPVVEIEWRNARINHPLEKHDCVALFTYTPRP